MKVVSGASVDSMGGSATAAGVRPASGTIAGLRKAASDCKACDLWKTATQTVFGEGPLKPQIMFVGEQPRTRKIGRGILLLDLPADCSTTRWSKPVSIPRRCT